MRIFCKHKDVALPIIKETRPPPQPPLPLFLISPAKFCYRCLLFLFLHHQAPPSSPPSPKLPPLPLPLSSSSSSSFIFEFFPRLLRYSSSYLIFLLFNLRLDVYYNNHRTKRLNTLWRARLQLLHCCSPLLGFPPSYHHKSCKAERCVSRNHFLCKSRKNGTIAYYDVSGYRVAPCAAIVQQRRMDVCLRVSAI